MAQKFKFKLDGLLKVREFNEKRIKVELGQILKEIAEVEDRIRKINKDIEETYDAQEKFIETPSMGRMIQFFPQFIQAKKDEIKVNENLLYSLKRKYEFKVQEMAKAKGEVKILENFKEKKKDEHKKAVDKKLLEMIEELTMSKKHQKSKEESK